jgi:hypothetical protein
MASTVILILALRKVIVLEIAAETKEDCMLDLTSRFHGSRG